eukprot:TRINITY_DN110465_c0_g1_i1.p1 TRINITY_DN110465_c0_g1~~TRINITY_DN110465_c0_g1_i1.p1  ORF type:complete len:184 (-),score=40.76 TRINITY_DN110465_c0_g1_i1:44-595(-)
MADQDDEKALLTETGHMQDSFCERQVRQSPSHLHHVKLIFVACVLGIALLICGKHALGIGSLQNTSMWSAGNDLLDEHVLCDDGSPRNIDDGCCGNSGHCPSLCHGNNFNNGKCECARCADEAKGDCDNGKHCTQKTIRTCFNGASCHACHIDTCEHGANCYCKTHTSGDPCRSDPQKIPDFC